MNGCCSEILDELNLTESITGCCRNRKCAKTLSTQLEAQATSKHTIAGRVLEDIVFTQTYHVQTTGNSISPFINILLSMEYNRRITCCAT